MASQKPTPVRTAAYATRGETRLYIVGGFQASLTSSGTPTAPAVNQFASLDLTIPTWNATDPPWTLHPSLPFTPGVYPLFAVFPKSQAQLIVASGDDGPATMPVATFDLASNSWSQGAPFANDYTGSSGVLAAVDPTVDTIIVPTGTTTSTSPEVYGTFLYDIATKVASTAPGPETVGAQVPATLREYAIAWSSVRGSVLVYGGRAEISGNQMQYSSSLLEFSSKTRTWKELPTTGQSPGGSNWGCLVPAQNGQKMILFGGYTRDVLTPSIYILDVAKLEWKKGQDIDPSLRRYEHVCAAAGDSFIAWGGLNSAGNAAAFRDPIIYDIKAERWTQQFALTSPSTNMTTPNNGSPSSTDGPSSKPETGTGGSSNLGAIVGAIAGVIVILLIIGFFVYKRRRRRQSQDSLPTKNMENSKTLLSPDLNSMPPPPPPLTAPSELWSNEGTSDKNSGGYSPSNTLFATTASHPSFPPMASLQERRNPHTQQHSEQHSEQPRPPLSPQEYPVNTSPYEYYPPPPAPQRPHGPSTYDLSLDNLDNLPSTSPPHSPISADPYQAYDENVYVASPHMEYQQQMPQPRSPQHREETDLERRLRIEQQEIEQLELAHLIRQKKLNMERMLEEHRTQSQSLLNNTNK